MRMKTVLVSTSAILISVAAAASSSRQELPDGTVTVPQAAARVLQASVGVSAAALDANGCETGTWSVVAMPDAPAVQLQSAHFAMRWTSGTTTTAAAQTALNELESIYTQFVDQIGFPAPSCSSTAKKKVNIWIGDFGLSGGVDGSGNPGMWIGPGALADNFGLAHEFTHALQGGTGGLRDSPYVGWMWESHANWMATQRPQYRSNVHCSELMVNAPHLYYGSTRDRYCNFQFWEYLKNVHGYAAVNNIWRNAPKTTDANYLTADPFTVLMSNMGWSVSQLNDFFGQWAMHNVNWDYTDPDGTDHGAIMRAAYGSNDAAQNGDYGYNGYRLNRTTRLDPVNLSARKFSVPFAQAPQRWGYNLVRLVPDSGATSIGVTFRGVTQSASNTSSLPGLLNEPTSIPAPNSGWRWGVVAITSTGGSRYSALQSSANTTINFALQPGDQRVYMVVLAAPTANQKIRWDQPYYSIYRYPWMVQLTGAQPQGFESGAPAPITGGHQHSNGGGWVAAGATVASTAYVGPYARVYSGSVTGNARVEDHATVFGGSLSGSAVAGGLAVVAGNTSLTSTAKARTTFMPLGYFETNIALSGTAQLIGDVEHRGGASPNHGVFFGFVDPNTINDAAQGANLTAPPTEVTATPNYSWP